MNESTICHYGVKGMKWGVRKERSTKEYLKKVNEIVDTMSKIDREKLGLYNSRYRIEKGEKIVTKLIKYIDKTPISFFDIVEGPNYLNATVGTRSEKEYRGKGYAKEVVKSGMDWWDANKDKYKNQTVNWWVRDDNPGSAKIAKDTGFKLNRKKSAKYNGWQLYERK